MDDRIASIDAEHLVVVATIGDPRTDAGAQQVERKCVRNRLDACRLAGKWSTHGYWISVYVESGEGVLEAPLV